MRRGRRGWTGAAAIIAAVAFAVAAPAAACPAAGDPTVRVVAVPEPLVLVLADGRTVRLAGVTLAGLEEAGGAMSRAALTALALGRDVRLAPVGGGLDRYGRTVARVVRADDGADVAVALAAGGAALAGGAPRDDGCGRPVLTAEAAARRARRGGWSDGTFAVLVAGDPELAGNAGRYVIVEGRVLSVGRAGRIHYLNFGRRWTLDFTVVIAESDAQALEQAGFAPASLAGVRVRVRGWLEARDGGLLQLTRPSDIERLGKRIGTGG